MFLLQKIHILIACYGPNKFSINSNVIKKVLITNYNTIN